MISIPSNYLFVSLKDGDATLQNDYFRHGLRKNWFKCPGLLPLLLWMEI